ncbi:TetR/AcrR family transcriptional regulator [Zavarzinia compransoris]|nr:TetR/AcrR family transcriptional regulator [Zavarzinia marina]
MTRARDRVAKDENEIASAGEDPSGALDLPKAGAPRRRPVQARGRKRVEQILAAAETLIRQKGVDALKMSEIATAADVPIGSIYQFFADRGAILRALAERYMAANRRLTEDKLRDVRTIEDAKRKLWQVIDQSFATTWADTAFRDVWFGLLADRELQALNHAAARQVAVIIVEALKPLFPHLGHDRLMLAASTMVHMSEGLVRSVSLEEEAVGYAMVREYKHLVALYLRDLSIEE